MNDKIQPVLISAPFPVGQRRIVVPDLRTKHDLYEGDNYRAGLAMREMHGFSEGDKKNKPC